MRRGRPSVLLAACGLILAGLLLDGPAVRRGTLRAVSSISGRGAAALRRLSVAAGLRYTDLAYPPVPHADDAGES